MKILIFSESREAYSSISVRMKPPTDMTYSESLHHFIFDDDMSQKMLTSDMRVPLYVVGLYVLFVKVVGPRAMMVHKPFGLRRTMIVYNFTQTLLNAYVAHKFLSLLIRLWPDHCDIQKCPRYEEYFKESFLNFWHLLLLKYLDLIDTVFFVLRKKTGQISHLHVFHHGAMCLIFSYGASNGMRNGSYLLLVGVSLNTCVHVVMYFYYAVSALGPSFHKYLWWKRYMTGMQIIQFVIVLVYATYGFASGCENPGPMEVTVFLFVLAVLVLFLNFYRKTFRKA